MHIPLISLKQGSKFSNGSIFCFPGAGDSVTSFISLANAMVFDLPVYGFQPRGLVAGQEFYTSIESMAEEYSKMIPSKPKSNHVFLVGHSFGGYVAMRVAQKLRERGFSIGTLILLDVTAPLGPHSDKSREQNLLGLIETIELGCEQKFNITLDSLSRLDSEAQLELIHLKMKEVGLISKLSNYKSIRRMVDLFLANCDMEFYPEMPYVGDSLLICATDSNESVPKRHQNFLTWRSFLPNLNYTETAGNHITLLNAKNVPVLVEILKLTWNL